MQAELRAGWCGVVVSDKEKDMPGTKSWVAVVIWLSACSVLVWWTS